MGWVKRASSDNNETVLFAGNQTAAGAFFSFFGGAAMFGSSNADAVQTASFNDDADVWHHWTLTFYASSSHAVVFRDGEQQGFGTASLNHPWSSSAGVLVLGSSGDVALAQPVAAPGMNETHFS